MTFPGIGPSSATAIAAIAPPVETFAKGRHFAQTIVTAPATRAPSTHKEGKAIGVLLKGPRRREFWTTEFAHTGLISDIVFWSAQGQKGPICFAKQLQKAALHVNRPDGWSCDLATDRIVSDCLAGVTGSKLRSFPHTR
jgi:hypothetical protein